MRWTLAALAVAVGAPFFALATMSPILQRWYSVTRQPRAGDPYFLYAASNVGSVVGLVGYPVIVESTLSLSAQAVVWAWAFAIVGGLLIVTGLVTLRDRRPGAWAAGQGARPTSRGVGRARRLRWVGLAAVPAALLLGVTHHLTTDVASVPLLWVVPLGIYLATFVVTFGRNPHWLRKSSAWTLKVLAIPVGLSLMGVVPLGFDMAITLTAFAAAAIVAHGELVATRPPADRLTEFYLLVSMGGAVGGTLTAIVAPAVFPVVLEYPLALTVALTFLPAMLFSGYRRRETIRLIAIGGGAGVAAILALIAAPDGGNLAIVMLAAVGIAVYVIARRPDEFAVGVGVVLMAATLAPIVESVHFDRSFFGTLVVDDIAGVRHLTSGSTVHGSQALEPALSGQPRTYYHRAGPVGDLFTLRDEGPHRTAVVGLGAGSIATYSRPGDTMTFLEIDPSMAAVAANPEYFTYLSRARGTVTVLLGDGRLLLETTDREFDLLVLDAFTSDAIPVHLMTEEAMSLYLSRLADGGVMAYHVSNRHLDLAPVLAGQAERLGLAIRGSRDTVSPEESAAGKWQSSWVAVAANESDLTGLDGWVALSGEGAPRWTDDYSNLIEVLKLW